MNCSGHFSQSLAREASPLQTAATLINTQYSSMFRVQTSSCIQGLSSDINGGFANCRINPLTKGNDKEEGV